MNNRRSSQIYIEKKKGHLNGRGGGGDDQKLKKENQYTKTHNVFLCNLCARNISAT